LNTKKINVLIVDDHLIVRNGIRMMLDTTSDIQVASEAASAEEALLLLQITSFDVVLLDIRLPDMNGLELCKLLHTSHPKLPILMLSMHSEEVYSSRALKFGASGYLTKNSPVDILTTAIRTVAGGGQHFSTDPSKGSPARPHHDPQPMRPLGVNPSLTT